MTGWWRRRRARRVEADLRRAAELADRVEQQGRDRVRELVDRWRAEEMRNSGPDWNAPTVGLNVPMSVLRGPRPYVLGNQPHHTGGMWWRA